MNGVYRANTITGMLTSLHWVLDVELSFQSDTSAYGAGGLGGLQPPLSEKK